MMGENILIHEKIDDYYGLGQHSERVLPNYFNEYFGMK